MDIENVLLIPQVKTGLEKAWRDSNPVGIDAHEEGGFVVRGGNEDAVVIRWPKGTTNEIELPPHKNCRFSGKEILLSFHTHPNTGSSFQQEPSITDIRAVKADPDLKGENYLGELVISCENIFLIDPEGEVRTICTFTEYFER